MTITADQVGAMLARGDQRTVYPRSGLMLLADGATRELTAWGHEGHEVALERIAPFYGDPGLLRWVFWCETCHVLQLALLSRPPAE